MQEETGNPDFKYELVCNKICGQGHYGMKYEIVVVDPPEYAEWYASQDPWLKKNPEYLSHVPSELKEEAFIKLGIESNHIDEPIENSLIGKSK